MKRNREDLDSVAVFIIWLVASLIISLFLMVAEAEASRTMHLVDSYIDDGVKVCVYSDGKHYAYTERNRASTCPYTHIEYTH